MDKYRGICYEGSQIKMMDFTGTEAVWDFLFQNQDKYHQVKLYKYEGNKWEICLHIIDGTPNFDWLDPAIFDEVKLIEPVSIAETFDKLATAHPTRENHFELLFDLANGDDISKPKLKVIENKEK
ncbi:hypothetical protein [Brevibacillus laterosporus]|uniref:hypothetical protein n=1 Tax=Brevibacillus laterosporus TaxID=1465 RepID=UPI003D1FC504